MERSGGEDPDSLDGPVREGKQSTYIYSASKAARFNTLSTIREGKHSACIHSQDSHAGKVL